MRTDFLVRTTDNRPLLAVEVKGRPKADRAWAAKLRRNMLAHGALPEVPYFLLALPDHFYLWTNSSKSIEALPDFEADTQEVLKNYLSERARSTAEGPSESSLQFAIWSWLNDLTVSKAPQSTNSWLQESGLEAQVKQGAVVDWAMS